MIPSGMAVPDRLQTVAVVGNGIIGHGVSQVFAMAGRDVRMIGRADASLRTAMERIADSLALFKEHGLISDSESAAALARVSTTTRLEDAADAQLVVEALPEDPRLRTDLSGPPA